MTEQIQNCKLHQLADKYGCNPFPALAQVWQDYKALYRERAALAPNAGEFDRWSLITHYLNCLPSNMRDMLRHVKDANGQVKEPDDPIMLENSILALGDQFLLDLKKRRDIREGKRPANNTAGPFGSSPGAGGSHPNSGKKRPNAFDKGKGKGGAQDKGKKPFRPTHTFWEYNDPKTQSFWVRDMTLDQI